MLLHSLFVVILTVDRGGGELDYIERICKCSPRQILDKNVNKHVESFLDLKQNANSMLSMVELHQNLMITQVSLLKQVSSILYNCPC